MTTKEYHEILDDAVRDYIPDNLNLLPRLAAQYQQPKDSKTKPNRKYTLAGALVLVVVLVVMVFTVPPVAAAMQHILGKVFFWSQTRDLRAGPSALFPSLGSLSQDAKVTVIGKARGDDWLFIDDGQRQGWVYRENTSLMLPGESADLSSLPILDTGKVVVIQGRVVDSNGAPLAGIEFAANQGGYDPIGARAHSLADGHFYLYLPEDASGTWLVGLTSLDCKSPIVDANCQHTGTFLPIYQEVTLPDNQLVEFYFMR